MLDQIRDNLELNLARVESLVVTYETHANFKGKGRKSAKLLDILRAAVVLLHASLEDVLRTTAAWKLPTSSRETLNAIPLTGHGPNPIKFFLGDLVAFRGKTVNDVFLESVTAYLEKSNYNNPEEIRKLLVGVGVDVSKCDSEFPRLRDLMARRHQIVHRADRQERVIGSGDHKIRAINRHKVREWVEAVREFTKALSKEL
jgi:hypothetical protein